MAKKKKKRNKHHLTPRSRHGSNAPSNIILIDIEKHECWHTIFHNKTLEEVIKLLQRLQRKKRR